MTPHLLRPRLLASLLALPAALTASACNTTNQDPDGSGGNAGASSEQDPSSPSATEKPDQAGGSNSGTSPNVDPAPDGPAASKTSAGACDYTNRFTSTQECKQYTGAGWNAARASQDCEGEGGAFTAQARCATEAYLGTCTLDGETDDEVQLVFPGTEESACSSTQMGCEVFAGGSFSAGPVCGGTDPSGGPVVDPGPGIGTDGNVYTEGPLVCLEPKDGEPGLSDGEVCTRSMIGACTEPGRLFTDYATCDTVLTQRPYYARPPANEPAAADDARLQDDAYMTELDWVKAQVESCGCVCCHSEKLAPEGASNWDIDAGPLWIDTFFDTGLAMGAGWVSSAALGAYPAEDNNGFSRDVSGLPTTDEERMIRFFEAELARRGKTPADFTETEPFGGPIYRQSLYEPTTCENGEGVDADGMVSWGGGEARYVFVMEEGTANPGAPPNLDKPEGTIWKIQVSATTPPMKSGFVYGEVPEEAIQTVPSSGQPAELSPGKTYALYTLADVGIPLTRCLFTFAP